MRALVLVHPPEAAEAFTSGLEDASEDVRKIASAGWLKAEAIPEEAVPALVGALSDPEAQVRANAARALARLVPVPAEAVPLLAECAAQPSDALRLSAALALQAAAPSGPRSEALHRLVGDPNVRVRLIAAGALLAEDAADAGAAAAVAEALSSPTGAYRRAAVGLVESLAEAGGELLDVLKRRAGVEEDPDLRAALARAVERLAGEAAGGGSAATQSAEPT
jgi:HEAT repeat protein